jgi:hypothetical protein
MNEVWVQSKIYILVGSFLVEIFYLSLVTGTGSKLQAEYFFTG